MNISFEVFKKNVVCQFLYYKRRSIEKLSLFKMFPMKPLKMFFCSSSTRIGYNQNLQSLQPYKCSLYIILHVSMKIHTRCHGSKTKKLGK